MCYSLRLALVLAAFSVSAHAQAMLDFNSLKRDTQVFERIVDERLKQDFTNPFAITGDPKAAYLQGYGIVVQFQLNINRAKIRTPFGDIDAPQTVGGRTLSGQVAGAQQKAEQLQKVKNILIDCLANYAGAIKQLNAHDRVSISAHIEDRNELDPILRKTVIVVTTSRDDVDLLAMRKITADDYRSRVQVLEY